MSVFLIHPVFQTSNVLFSIILSNENFNNMLLSCIVK